MLYKTSIRQADNGFLVLLRIPRERERECYCAFFARVHTQGAGWHMYISGLISCAETAAESPAPPPQAVLCAAAYMHAKLKAKRGKVQNLTSAHSNTFEICPPTAGAPTYDRCHSNNERTTSPAHTRKNKSARAACTQK